MRLVKRAPLRWLVLGFLTLACEFGLDAIPEFGSMLEKVIVPLVACGMLYAAAATDRGAAPSVRHALAAFSAPASAMAAVIAAGLYTFAAEGLAAWWIAGVNLFVEDTKGVDMSLPEIAGVYAFGILASLPITFVPFHVLFERVPVGAAFAASWRGFALNAVPLLVYAAASLVLLLFGLATMGIGLVLVLPLWAASSYAAWKDVFGVAEAPAAE